MLLLQECLRVDELTELTIGFKLIVLLLLCPLIWSPTPTSQEAKALIPSPSWIMHENNPDNQRQIA